MGLLNFIFFIVIYTTSAGDNNDDITCGEFIGTFEQTFQVASTMQQMEAADAEHRIIDELNKHTDYEIHYSMISIEQQSFGRIKMQTILDMFKNKKKKRRYMSRFGSRDNRESNGSFWEAKISARKECVNGDDNESAVTTRMASYIAVDISTCSKEVNGVYVNDLEEVHLTDVTINVEIYDCSSNNGDCSHICTNEGCKCPSCWVIGDDGKTCQPHSDAVKLECTQDEMVVQVKKCLTPDATEISFVDQSCKTEINDSDDIYQISTTLDACSTKLTWENGKLKFSNSLTVQSTHHDTFISADQVLNKLIVTTNSSFEVVCSFQTVYDNISTENVVKAPHFQGTTDGTGKLSFSLTQHETNKYTSEISPLAVSSVGEILHFSLKIDKPVDGVSFTVNECIVKDDAIKIEWPVISGQCLDKFIGKGHTSMADSIRVGFSYIAFQFVESDEDIATLRLVCKVTACADNNPDSLCQNRPHCHGHRKRRSEPDNRFPQYSVSHTFRIASDIFDE